MRKLHYVALAVAPAILLLTPVTASAQTAQSNSIQVLSNTGNQELVQRVAVSGLDQTVLPTKTSAGKADPAALAEIKGSSNYGQIKNDLQNGKIVVFRGNGDGKLSDLLLRQAFDNDPNGPVSFDHHDSDQNSRLVAKAIAKIPGEKWFSIFSVYSNGPVTDQQIQTAVDSQYQTALQVAQDDSNSSTNTASANSTKISPDSTPTYSQGTYYYYSGSKYVYESNGALAGSYQWGYNMKRESTNGTNFSVWDTQRIDSETPGYVSGDHSSYTGSVWQSVGIMSSSGQPFYGENVVEFGPTGNAGAGTVTWSFSEDGPVVSYSYNIDPNGDESNRSVTGQYGAWSTAWGSGGSDQSDTLKPAIRATNSGGYMWESGDFKITFVPSYATSGDIGDSWDVPDL